MIDFGIQGEKTKLITSAQKGLLLQLSIQRQSMFRSRDFQNLGCSKK